LPPWWLRIAHGPNDRLLDVIRSLEVLSSLSCALILAGLVAATAAALRARRREQAAAGALALVLCATLAFVASSTPRAGLLPFTLGYTLWWGSPAGMFAWLALGWSIATLAPGIRVRLAALPRYGRLAPAALGAAFAIVTLVRAGAGEDVIKPHYAPVKALAARVRAELQPGRTVLVSAGSMSGFDPLFDFETGLIYDLRRDGTRVLTDTLGTSLGRYYDAKRHRYDTVLRLDHPGASRGGGAVVGRVAASGRRPLPPSDVIIATLSRARG
jgi:hypothetical protein